MLHWSRPLLLATALIAGMFGLVGHTYAANTVITNCANTAALQNEISAGGSKTITFDCGNAMIPFSLYIHVPNGSAIVIDGDSKITFDGENKSAFFQVSTGASLQLKNMTLKRGVFSASHALENFGDLSLDHVMLTQNVSTGSAVVNYGKLAIAGSALSDNSVSGGISMAGAALRNSGGSVTVVGTTFSNNTITGTASTGGAIANQSGTISVSDSSFSGNKATDGGAIQLVSGSAVTVTQSTFIGNQGGYGGAIEVAGGLLNVSRSRFENNRATLGDGGAIWVLDGTLTGTESQFSANQAATTGGAISCYGTALTLTRSSFNANQAASNGGAVYSTCALSMTNLTLSANSATGAASGGGAVYQAGSAAGSIAYATIADNSARFGAGIYNDGAGTSSLTISASVVVSNTTGNCDGVISSGGYNLSNNTTCGGAFTQPTDRQSVTVALSPLGSYGGVTLSRPPLAGSAVVDIIPNAQCATTSDQRGVSRPQFAACDSGAIELSASLPTPTITPTGTPTTTPGTMRRLFIAMLSR